MSKAKAKSEPWLFCCRAGMEQNLCDELADRCGGGLWAPGHGFVTGTPARNPVGVPLVFERQRLPGARCLERPATRPVRAEVVRAWLGPILQGPEPWTTHVYAARPELDADLSRQAHGLEQAFLRVCRDAVAEAAARWVDAADAKRAAWIVQLLVTPEQVWQCTCRSAEVTDLRPGGVHRMRMDPAAPSRSYLKIEEALERSGLEVRPGQQVVDLGAAPGGWSYAFLRRGCNVIGVDRGPMKLPDDLAAGRHFRHVREDGLSYAPPPGLRPVDWLVCDMLVPPGKLQGLLRRWIGERWARRLVATVKLPQQKPWPVVRDLLDDLARQGAFRGTLRQLYHDRQEITLWGECRV